MLKNSTIQLLRFHFSFFLMPVYLFALSQTPGIIPLNAVLVFFILHVLVYPSSNGYNSYMDRDTESIGGIEKPMMPTKQLFVVSIVMDILAITLSLLISRWLGLAVLAYILASRAYSYRGIRLKKYPVVGYFTVAFFQGAVTFFIVFHGCSTGNRLNPPWEAMAASSLLIGGFYPLTQIYQHDADRRDGVTTISSLLGYRGTFIFTALVYSAAMGLLAMYFGERSEELKFVLVATIMVPVLVYFFVWFNKVWKDTRQADFRNTMRMNLLASTCSNLAFLSLLIWKWFE